MQEFISTSCDNSRASLLRNASYLMKHGIEGTGLKDRIAQNVACILNVDETSTIPKRVFMGQNILIGSATNSPKQTDARVNTHTLKGVACDNDHMMILMGAVKN